MNALTLAVTLMMPATLAGQDVPASLSLEQALRIARDNNPTYLAARNDRDLADWDVRQAWTQLLVPSANASSSLSWQGAGQQRFGSITLDELGFSGQPSYYFSSYNLGLSYRFDGAALLAPSKAKAQRAATHAQIRIAENNLVSQVTTAYVDVLRQGESVRVAQQQLESSRINLRLAQGRLEVGAATPIDVGQAEVQVGRNEVALLQAQNALQTARMRLLQAMGVSVDRQVTLTTTFELQEPRWDLDELFARALEHNPTLEARQRSKDAADIDVKSARSAYYPTISLSTSLSGFTREASSTDFLVAQAQARVASQVAQCASLNDLYSRLADPLPPSDCNQFAFTDAQRRAIIDQNDQFPFNFERSPPSASLTISLPIFQGFTRQRQLEAAKLQRDDMRQQVREQELALRADLAVGLANVRTAYRSAQLEARNLSLAEEQLRLARERYRVGAITFVDLTDAETVKAQADRDRTAAVFAYHDAVTNLETLVGASLRR